MSHGKRQKRITRMIRPMEKKKDRFCFRQFEVRQEQCAMKVGTDGVLLGAWAHGGRRMLDVGCGTGLIALMLAQRYPDGMVDAIDIDYGARCQTVENVANSPFWQRIVFHQCPLQEFAPTETDDFGCRDEVCYDAIVCNPPFFVDSLKCPDARRTLARHADSLPFGELMSSAARLLGSDGEVSVIIPSDLRSKMDEAAVLAGLFPYRVCSFASNRRKPARRVLLSYTLRPVRMEHSAMTIGDEEYGRLTQDFYL